MGPLIRDFLSDPLVIGKAKPLNRGLTLKSSVQSARKSIYVTHFTPDDFDDEYIEAHLERLKSHSVMCQRIVALHPDYPETDYAWLDKFFEHKPFYKQYYYKDEASPPPYDIMVIDKKIAFLIFGNELEHASVKDKVLCGFGHA